MDRENEPKNEQNMWTIDEYGKIKNALLAYTDAFQRGDLLVMELALFTLIKLHLHYDNNDSPL